MNLESGWFQRFYQHLNGVPEVIVSSGVTPVGITEGPYEGKPNPMHGCRQIMLLIYVDNIRDALIKYDPANDKPINVMPILIKPRLPKPLPPA